MRIRCLAVAFGFAVGVLLRCDTSEAQSTDQPHRVGIMINGGSRPFIDRFRNDFVRLGYVDGKSIIIEAKFAEGRIERHPALAEELVRQNVDVILALGGPAARAAKSATAKIPVVFAIVTDPVAIGLVTSVERPGGNVTGVTSLDPQQARRQFELLKQVLPNLKRVAILSDRTIPGGDSSGLAPIDRASAEAARALGLESQIFKLNDSPAPDLHAAFANIVSSGAEALLVTEVPVPFAHRNRIAELAVAHRLPAMFPGGQADAGGLITFGTSVEDAWPLMTVQAHKILKGTAPAELAVEVVTRRELVLNLNTARLLGVTIPPDVLKRADRVIQ